MKKIIEKFQKQARKQGFYKGDIDGQAGPLTLSALELFYNLGESVPPWITWASKELGVSEIYGERDNPRIVHYHKYTGLSANDDETAWCASFVCAALEEGANIRSTRSAAASSYRKFGNDEPNIGRYGSICLKKTNTGSLRHVFFSVGVFNGYVFGLGGNQSNRVNITLFPLSEITECRYPKL